MKKIPTLAGYKTYLGFAALAILGFVVAQGWLTTEQAAPWASLAAGLAGIGIVHKFDRRAKK